MCHRVEMVVSRWVERIGILYDRDGRDVVSVLHR